ncbi:23S rRNA (cytidine1920-2'-O)/16S rRNA (cytidine1409-2'-O)-methyltransferase [Diaminobutyricimonas aerilata]|uniref:23S rRNA (Cytidine1920-2'-O)/16S rRNA (Cytidine1409-2'-O)-methyltransferase n=1 Tax=Diaminobutyricimonas aerilata TaxID=1162967 RepID=A0A2M9CGN0_9MICO|nr:TlyA family RNA methyltransferase [Diaminobutyricimonas aerilata]PJJ71039.1 23S rRNA (cytidine1920-2'-O)/16S rRNA (cytidine1409-2'-O)-methyltransferase [Diaminobutyricimonas aerilata]
MAPDDASLVRLDALLAELGSARSRTHAARLIADGLVSVDGRPALKPSLRVARSAAVEVAASDHYVSRAAHKLIAALDGFGVDPRGSRALDVGASTGGFTQVLLERGARHVVALDVGHGQLHPSIAGDDRVLVLEGVNARHLTAEQLRGFAGEDAEVDLVVGDLSFISLTQVLPALAATVGTDAEYVMLIKPQFEVGRGNVREGIVRDRDLRLDAVRDVVWAAFDLGLPTAGLMSSPLPGGAGNHEYLVRLSATHGIDPTEWESQIAALD